MSTPPLKNTETFGIKVAKQPVFFRGGVNLLFTPAVDNIELNIMIMIANTLKKVKSIPSYCYRNYAAPRIFSIRDREILAKNSELKNKYTDRRCFIIGAGPSIAATNLALLNKEYTFVVNEFEKNPQYTILTPKFHIITDSDYFTEGGTEYWINRFKEKDRHIPTDTIMIINLAARPFIQKYGLFKQHRVYYTGTQGIFTNKFSFNINLDRYVPNPKNSILMCLLAAVWMGFDEIYLLGCEHSFLARPLGPNKSLGFSHSYEGEASGIDITKKEISKKYINSKLSNSNYEALMLNTLQLFRNYRLFYAKALRKNSQLKIFNATPESFLDVFPMVNFNDIKKL